MCCSINIKSTLRNLVCQLVGNNNYSKSKIQIPLAYERHFFFQIQTIASHRSKWN